MVRPSVLLCLALACVFAQAATDSGSAWARSCASSDSDTTLTIRPDDSRWPAFLAWAEDRRLFTSRLLGFRAGAGVSLVWAPGTEWEAQVTLPMGQALGHLIAERNWRDVDFPEFFAERGGVYGINLAERLAMLDPGSPAPWRAFFDSLADTHLSARVSAIAPDGQSAEVSFGSGRVVTYSVERLWLDLSSFLTDCHIAEFLQASDRPDQPDPQPPASEPGPEPPAASPGQAVYERQCSGCHGTRGDGQGVFASHLSPRPRDFTQARFRYRSTPTGQLPTDEDVYRSVAHGLAGSGMPAFQAFLSPADIRDVVAYIKRFSARFERDPAPRPLALPVPPAVSAERIARGARLYGDSGCTSCHGDSGKGDGRSGQDLKTSEGEPITPRDLTDKWRFRGGFSPQAVFQRLMTGMDGSSMASYRDALTEDQTWDLVFYVLDLSPQDRPQARDTTTTLRRSGWENLMAGRQ
ncbi:MAG: c-type cytochrome [Desulfurellaceae bacterium]|nr:c-type cytochrome [Desulfurellaceae bacterium]